MAEKDYKIWIDQRGAYYSDIPPGEDGEYDIVLFSGILVPCSPFPINEELKRILPIVGKLVKRLELD